MMWDKRMSVWPSVCAKGFEVVSGICSWIVTMSLYTV